MRFFYGVLFCVMLIGSGLCSSRLLQKEESEEDFKTRPEYLEALRLQAASKKYENLSQQLKMHVDALVKRNKELE